MLEKVNLKASITKEEYKKEASALKEELSSLQQLVKQNKLPVIIVFEGWGSAGKGSQIANLILNFDPRGSKVYSNIAPTELEKREPNLWRYWKIIPGGGEIAVMDRSWYQEISVLRLEDEVDDVTNLRRMNDINTFERQLADNGYLIIKFFLHISQKEQRERLENLANSKNTEWRVTQQDWKRNKQYDRYYRAFDEMLEYTNTTYAPWHVIASTDRLHAELEISHTVIDGIKTALALKQHRKEHPITPTNIILPGNFTFVPMPKLKDVSLDKTITDEKYKKQLKKLQEELSELHNKIYRKRVPVVVCYEGWDAAGKGGNIRRVAAALDPRGYEVVPIASPTAPELAHHYLWRFWTRLPKDGHVAIFDRTWYGRVMVERIEGFCTTEDWQRAYREINEFERQLYDWGAVVVKFWLHIDQDEQLRRFNDRQNTPSKQWKITDEDWRNREKWDQYEEAIDDMLRYTSTDFAPWHIIESQNKKYGRIKALKILIDAIKDRL